MAGNNEQIRRLMQYRYPQDRRIFEYDDILDTRETLGKRIINYLNEKGNQKPVRWIDIKCGLGSAMVEAKRIYSGKHPLILVGVDIREEVNPKYRFQELPYEFLNLDIEKEGCERNADLITIVDTSIEAGNIVKQVKNVLPSINEEGFLIFCYDNHSVKEVQQFLRGICNPYRIYRSSKKIGNDSKSVIYSVSIRRD